MSNSLRTTHTSSCDLTRSEIEILKKIIEGKRDIKSIAGAAGLSISRTYALTRKLAENGFLKYRRVGMKKEIETSDRRHANFFKALIISHEINSEAVCYSNLRIFFSILYSPKTLQRISEETSLKIESIRKYIRKLKGIGLIYQVKGKVGMSASLPLLHRFLEEYAAFINQKVVSELSKNAIVVWQQGIEAIVRAPIKEKIPIPETAISALSGYGIDIITDHSYYYLPGIRKLGVEDIALHTILINPDSVRYISYALLLLKKRGFDRKKLLECGEMYGIGRIALDMMRFLEGEEVRKLPFPSQEEFIELCRLYGVER